MRRITKALILIGVALVILTAVFVATFNRADGKAFAELPVADQPYYYWGGSANSPASGFLTSQTGTAGNGSTFTNLVITAETDIKHETIEYIYLYYQKWYTSSTNRGARYRIYDGVSDGVSTRYIQWEWKQTASLTYTKSITFAFRDDGGSWVTATPTTLCLKFSSNDGTLSNGTTWGDTFLNDVRATIANAYNVINDCDHLESTFPTMIRRYNTDPPTKTYIYLYPAEGYRLPNNDEYDESINLTYTALEVVYYGIYDQIEVSNNQGDFTISGSLPSDTIEYNVTWNVTNGSGSPSTVTEGIENELYITPNQGFNYPTGIVVQGTYLDAQYEEQNGQVLITNPQSDITITAVCSPSAYVLTEGYYIPNIRVMEQISELSTLGYVKLPLQCTIYNSTGGQITATPAGTSYRYNIINNNFPDGEERDGILFDLTQNLGISAYNESNGEVTIQERIVTYDSGNNSFQYSSLYCLSISNDVSIPYELKDFFINVSDFITLYALGLPTYNSGYDNGINYNVLTDGAGGVIGAIFSGLFGQIFAVEIFPGFPLYIFILIPVVFTILSLVLWLMRGR